MTLYKALSVSEEMDCFIIHRQAGIRIKAKEYKGDPMGVFPEKGWQIDDTPSPIEFQCKFLGCDPISNNLPGGKSGAVYSFEGSGLFTMMPEGTPVKVTIEPL